MIDLVLDEGRWLVVALALASVVALLRGLRSDGRTRSVRSEALALLHAFYGTVIGTMASAHLLAVSIVTARGELHASPWLVYPLGIVLAAPAWWLVAGSFSAEDRPRRNFALNAWIALALLALGWVNWPLAAPAALNIAYARSRRSAVGMALLAIVGIFYLGLAVGGILFMASGESFEEFMGI